MHLIEIISKVFVQSWRVLKQSSAGRWGVKQPYVIIGNGATSGLFSSLAAYFMTSPPDHAMPGQSKRRRIDGIDATAGGVGLIELEVLSISGECMLTLSVADSILGRELWTMILDKIPSKPGLQLVVSHTSRLALNESLKQQGLGGELAQVWATYMPVNLRNAFRFAHGDSNEDEEFSLNGITEVIGVDDEQADLLHNLPKSLHTLTFAPQFNQSLRHVRFSEGLQHMTFGDRFNQSLDNVTWPAGLQSVIFRGDFNCSLDNVTWPAGLQSMTFGKNFNQSLDNVTWPAGLQSLTFQGDFNQSLNNVTWPAALQRLIFGFCFNQSLDNVTWPAGLQSLTFVENFDQSLDKVTWPAGLQSLTLGENFDQSLDKVTWPAGLQSLTFGDNFRSEPGQRDMASRPSKFDFW